MNPYVFHISFYDVLFTGAVFIGLNFAVLLAFAKSVNNAANRFLALALVTMILWMMRILAIDIRLQSYITHWDRVPTQFLLGLGPLIYFYVLKISRPEYKFRWKDLLHFSPLLLEQGALVLEITESSRTGVATYDTLTFAQVDPVLQLLIFISLIAYLHRSYQLIEDFYRRLQPILMDRSRLEYRWLRRLLAATGFLWVLWITYAAVNYFGYNGQSGVHDYYPFYIFFAVIIIWTAAAAFLKPQAALLIRPVPAVKPIPSNELKQKGIWLKMMVKENRYYQDPELSLNSLAEKLDLTPHELSRIINAVLKKSFNDFINEYRVQSVSHKMQDPAYNHITIIGIAYESGFNSQSSFNRIFKQITGKSPLGYKNEQKKEQSSYNLGARSQLAPVNLSREITYKWSRNKLNRNIMFKNYLKIAWRNMLYNKVYSALNIVGLATGMAVALLIGLWAFNQYSYDRFLPGYQQAYSVKVNYTNPHTGTYTQDNVALPLADVLRNTIPGIKYVAETSADFSDHNFLVGDKKLLVSGGTVAPDFLRIFKYPLVRGDINGVLKDAHSVVLDESTAKALFGDEDPVNKVIRVDNLNDVKVTGVMKDFPANSSMKFQFLMPFSYIEQTYDWVRNSRNQWDNNSFAILVGLQADVSAAQIASKIKNLITKYNPADAVYKPEVFLYPLKDWHLRSDFKNGKAAGGFIDYVRMFSIIGALVLLIACINFVNMSTARSEKRAREVGIRKTIGSNRRDLIFQFMIESLLVTGFAFLLSIVFVQLGIPYFDALSNNSIRIPYNEPVFWCIMIAYVLVIGILAGARPAFYLSGFTAISVLKGTIQLGKAAVLPRKVLVVLQFTCSVAFIIGTVIIYQQIQYAKNRPAGFKTDRLVSTFMTMDLANHYDALNNDLVDSRMVENVTKSSSAVTNVGWHTGIVNWPGHNAGELQINVGAVIVNDKYFQTVGMRLTGGHNFSDNLKADSSNIIVNEAAVKRMNLKDPIGQLVSFNGFPGQSRIIGVVKDALMESPFKPVEPTVFVHTKGWCSQVIYRLAPGVNPHTAIEKIGKIFDKYNPAYSFSYRFADDEYDHKFSLETLVGKLAGIFAGLAVFVSCLGLFGLAAYVAEQRTKEIGIRKVLGASVTEVWLLLTQDFVILVAISCVIASPVALYFLRDWLQKYDYRISIGPGVFVLSAVTAIAITVLTISFQALKAAIANPVKSLRSE